MAVRAGIICGPPAFLLSCRSNAGTARRAARAERLGGHRCAAGPVCRQGTAYRGDELLRNIAGLLARARADGVPVFHVRHDGGPGHPLARGSDGWPHHPAVAPRAGEAIVDKRQSSAFHDTDFHTRLRVSGIDRLVVAGIQTEMLVEIDLPRCRHARLPGSSGVGRPYDFRHRRAAGRTDHRASQPYARQGFSRDLLAPARFNSSEWRMANSE